MVWPAEAYLLRLLQGEKPMFKKFLFLLLFYSSFLQAETITVTPAMIDAAGKLTIKSHTASAVIFSDGDYSRLTEFDVSYNPLLSSLTIPGTLTALRRLNVFGNPLLSSLTIPETLTALRVLDVYGNPLLPSLTIPDTLTALRKLHVSDNRLLPSLTIPGTLTALRELSVSYSPLLTSLTMDNAMINRSHRLARVTPRTPQSLAIAARQPYTRIHFETEDVTVMAAGGGGGAHAGQEALTAEREQIMTGWRNFSALHRDLLKASLPRTQLEADPLFDDDIYPKMSTQLLDFIGKNSDPKIKFKLQVALQGLDLLHGDLSAPTYHGVDRRRYRTTTADDRMPTSLQVFVLLYRIAENREEQFTQAGAETFVRGFLAETYGSKFARFKSDFPKYAHYALLGEILKPTDKKGQRLVSALARLIRGEENDDHTVFGDKIPSKIIKKMAKQFGYKSRQDVYNPLYEALFMTLRGHNYHFYKESEVHKPACPFGGYLQLLRVLADPSFELTGSSSFGGIEITSCGPE